MATQDRARKKTLIEYGFRLPSAIDNRPLTFEEFNKKISRIIYVSATPEQYEKEKAGKKYIVEQLIRPTGLLEPSIEIRPTKNQVEDLIREIRERSEKKQRILVLTLTKRLAEALSEHLTEKGIKTQWLHAEVKTLERPQILKDLREGKYDVLVGINLLREGLDLPEVSLVVILDADKEGFLRSETSLIQVAGRAARHIDGYVIMYADTVTNSMRKAIDETNRRRKKQTEFNKANNITPRSIEKSIKDGIESFKKAEEIVMEAAGQSEEEYEKEMLIAELEREMELRARNLQFEAAAQLRDKIKRLKK